MVLACLLGLLTCCPATPARLPHQIKYILGLETEHASTIQDIITQVVQNIDDFNW